jgi:hypothetical protein
VAYTFDIEVNSAGTQARFRIYADNNPAAVFDETVTTGVPYGFNIQARFAVIEASTTASDIGILYSLGIGTIAGFNRVRGQ